MIDISHIDHHHTDGHEEHNSHDKHFKSDRINNAFGTVFLFNHLPVRLVLVMLVPKNDPL